MPKRLVAPLVARRLMYLEPSLWPLLEMLRSSASIPAGLVTQLRGLPEAGRGGGGSGDSRLRLPAAVPRFTSLKFEEGRGAAAPALLTLVQEPVGDLVVACLPRPRTRPSVIYVAAAP
jgi:hypothetical protein